jgi:hypothetical protein
MVEHVSLTDPNLHEPKGVALATSGTVYVANGVGSGSWQLPSATETGLVDSAGRFVGNNVEEALSELWEGSVCLTTILADVSSSSSILIPIPYSVSVVSIDMVLGGGITSTDATVSVLRSDGASMGSQTVAYLSSTEGTAFRFTPSGNSDLDYPTHKYIKISTDGASTGSVPLYITVNLKRT